MTVYAFILTFILGGFTMTPAFIWAFITIDERNQAKKKLMVDNPTNLKVGPNPFRPTILNYQD